MTTGSADRAGLGWVAVGLAGIAFTVFLANLGEIGSTSYCIGVGTGVNCAPTYILGGIFGMFLAIASGAVTLGVARTRARRSLHHQGQSAGLGKPGWLWPPVRDAPVFFVVFGAAVSAWGFTLSWNFLGLCSYNIACPDDYSLSGAPLGLAVGGLALAATAAVAGAVIGRRSKARAKTGAQSAP